MKKGDKIKMYFRLMGVISTETREVRSVYRNVITTTSTLHTERGEEYEKFDKTTGKCLNDNRAFGARRYIDPVFLSCKEEQEETERISKQSYRTPQGKRK